MANEEMMFIAGEWCNADGGVRMEIHDPSSGEIIATVPKGGTSDVERAIVGSKSAMKNPEWANMDPAGRGRILQKMAQLTYGAAKDLAAIESKNNGKTFREALSEIRYGAWTLEYFAGWADKVEGSTVPVP